jgi:hypothetical protein
VERTDETAAGQRTNRYGTVAFADVERRRYRHSDLDFKFAFHVNGQVAKERRPGRRLAVLGQPSHQLRDAVGDAAERGHGDGLTSSDVRLWRPFDDFRRGLEVAHNRYRLLTRSKLVGLGRISPPPHQHYPAAMSDASQQSNVAPRAAAEPWVSEPEYREGAVDLLGILAYGALAAFDRLAEDARRAPTLADKVYVASLAALQMTHFDAVRVRLGELDMDVMAAMKPFRVAFDEFHARTRPKDWLEGLVLAYVGNGFAADFYREVAAFVDPDTRALVHRVLADEGHADFVVERVRAGIAADPRVAGRLALWGRRLVGEALSQAQRVAANRDALTHLLTGTVDRPGLDLAAMSRMFSRLVENHARRMAQLGLQG